MVEGGEPAKVLILNILNPLPFTFAPVPGRLGFPGHSLSLIVKGTFDLSSGGKASIAEKQIFPTGDEYYADDDEMAGGLRYESDFACFKPRADLLLVGKCHPPGRQPAQICPVTFRVGGKSRTLTVTGNRFAQRHDQRWSRYGAGTVCSRWNFAMRTASEAWDFRRIPWARDIARRETMPAGNRCRCLI